MVETENNNALIDLACCCLYLIRTLHPPDPTEKCNLNLLPSTSAEAQSQVSEHANRISIMVYTLVCHLYCKDDESCISKVKNKLLEASRIYRKDRETMDWIVMQNVHDPRRFSIVERFENEGVSHACSLRRRISSSPSAVSVALLLFGVC